MDAINFLRRSRKSFFFICNHQSHIYGDTRIADQFFYHDNISVIQCVQRATYQPGSGEFTKNFVLDSSLTY
jgi:hypothetical protein